MHAAGVLRAFVTVVTGCDAAYGLPLHLPLKRSACFVTARPSTIIILNKESPNAHNKGMKRKYGGGASEHPDRILVEFLAQAAPFREMARIRTTASKV